jgi:hypothetical protein
MKDGQVRCLVQRRRPDAFRHRALEELPAGGSAWHLAERSSATAKCDEDAPVARFSRRATFPRTSSSAQRDDRSTEPTQRVGNCVHDRSSPYKERPDTFRHRALENSRQRPTLPRSFPRSTIGGSRLNFRVRNGNGCDPAPVATGNSMRPSRGAVPALGPTMSKNPMTRGVRRYLGATAHHSCGTGTYARLRVPAMAPKGRRRAGPDWPHGAVRTQLNTLQR